MTARKTRSCVIGDFIAAVTESGERIPDRAVHFPFAVLIRQIEESPFCQIIKRRSLLDDQAVSADVFGIHPGDRRERVDPVCRCLARQCEHEICVDISDTGFSESLKARLEILKAVDTAEFLQLVIMCRLKSAAYPVPHP